jgi:hypothetical protein
LKGDLKTDTASEITTAAVRLLQTKYRKKKLKTGTGRKCRLYPKYEDN